MIDQENFLEAIRSGDQAQVNAMLETAPWLIDTHDATGASALLVAVYNGQPEIVEELLARDYELDIWEAAATGQVARAAKLVTANPELANAYAPDGFTPLGLAAFFGHLEVLALMLQSGAEVNYPSRESHAGAAAAQRGGPPGCGDRHGDGEPLAGTRRGG